MSDFLSADREEQRQELQALLGSAGWRIVMAYVREHDGPEVFERDYDKVMNDRAEPKPAEVLARLSGFHAGARSVIEIPALLIAQLDKAQAPEPVGRFDHLHRILAGRRGAL